MLEKSMLTWSPADLPPALLAEQSTESVAMTSKQRNAEELWKTLQKILPDARMQRLAYLLFHCALKPREIISACPQEFSDLQEVQRLRQIILERLLRHNVLTDEA